MPKELALDLERIQFDPDFIKNKLYKEAIQMLI
jgi:hypothetical protein